jgi:S-disulfanyl-L-cysteine oxidoreductase SoxD
MFALRHIASVVAVAALGLSTGYALSAAEPTSQDAPKPATPADGIYNQAQAQRGQATYTQACSACHLADLSGSDQAPSLAGGDFLDRWDGQSVGDLVDRIRTSMPADNVGSLNTQSATDIVAYILQANKFPTGQDELKADRTFLKTITFKK